MSLQYPIKVVAQRTGLSQHVIRVWEKRYGAVSPARTDTNRRLYSEDAIERLSLLRQATAAGHSIGGVAQLPTLQLQSLLAQAQASAPVTARTDVSDADCNSPETALVDECLQAIRRLDDVALEEILGRASVKLGHQGLLQNVVVPLTHAVGEQWQEGSLKVAHEHFASSVIRNFLSHISRPFAATEHAPRLIVATPAGQLHELGAVIAAAAAASKGWKVTFLGASLPAHEIAGAAVQNHARAVALSIVYPADDPNVAQELLLLRKYLPETVPILVGGRSAESYHDAIDAIGAQRLTDLAHLCRALDELRVRRPAMEKVEAVS